ncbi:DUF4349 domain-containing protein [Streptomyces sp. NPDC089919]|uniref:DUF4349 domain-containing protein n=1 Tax=Streptomyces sp. NPDC089919 TaxID=3155188 RepID=UPI0034315F4A
MRAVRAARRRTATALAALSLAGALALAGCGSADDRGSDAKSGARADIGRQDADGSGGSAARPGAGGSGGGTAGTSGTGGAAADGKAAGSPAPGKAPAVLPKIIRTARLSLEVKDTQAALVTARAAATGAGGYVGDESTRREPAADGRQSVVSELTLRVPVERFDAVLGALSGGGRLLSRKVDAQDVTRQVVDVESRVASQRASVARVRAMMDRADQLSDVVMLEGELSRRQAELESLLAQRDSLADQTAMATVTVSLAEPGRPAPPAAKDDEPGFTDAVSAGFDVFVAVLRWISLVLGALLPFLAAGALAALVFRAVRRARPGRKAAPATAERESAAVPAMPSGAPEVPAQTGPAPVDGETPRPQP